MESIKKIINSESGSMLLYSLLMVFVLTMLGVSVIGLSMSNFKMGRLASDKNKAFYAADAAVEHAMWVIDDETAKAEKKAREWADGEFASKLNGESISEENANALVEAEFKRVYFGTLLGLDNLLDDSLLKYEPIYDDKGKKTGEKLDPSKTLETYKNFEEDVLEDESISVAISDRIQNFKYESEFGEESGKSKKISMKSDYVISDTKDENGGSVAVSIESEGSYKKIRKTLEASLYITLPEYEYTSASGSISKNSIYSKAFMSRGGIVVTGGNVQVKDGGIFAYGPIVVGDENDTGDNPKLNIVNASMATRSNIRIIGDKASLNISGTGSNAYSDSIIVEISKNSNIQDNIKVTDDILMYGNIEIKDGSSGKNKGNISKNIWNMLGSNDADREKKKEIDENTGLLGTGDEDIFGQLYNESVKVNDIIDSDGKVAYIKTNDIYIEDGQISDSGYHDNNSLKLPNNPRGIIFTTGNIFIKETNGNFKFEGSIIAGGNIFFSGKGTKHITYNEKSVMDIISSSEELKKFFYANEGKKVQFNHDTGDVKVVENEETVYYPSASDKTEYKKIGKSYTINYWREAK